MSSEERETLNGKCDDIARRVRSIRERLMYGITREDKAFIELVHELME